MPKNWDAIFEDLARRNATSAEYDAELDKHCQHPADKRSFSEWSAKSNQERLNFEMTPPSTEFLVENLQRINFHFTKDGGAYKQWLEMMGHGVQRMIPLGRTPRAFYALRPAPRCLRPDVEDREEEFPDVKVKDTAFMGVSTNRPTDSPSSYWADTHRDRGKEQRSNTTDSEGHGNGFVFHQLGILESAGRLPGAENDPTKCTFEDTGFFVVARLAPSGVAEGLYIIYDKFPTDPEEGVRAEFPAKEVAPLPHETGHFSMARLSGPSLLNGRDFNTQILWLERCDYPAELVLAKERVMGRGLVRLTVYD